ncbi:MAG: hypothetical protein MZW92_05100 [Comamonadaceae bacterium]|nr:hypothetical protein [Comamonadaceae bacterium]
MLMREVFCGVPAASARAADGHAVSAGQRDVAGAGGSVGRNAAAGR